MKCLLQKIVSFVIVSLFLIQIKLFSQITTINAVYTPAVNSAGAAGVGAGITFSVQNTNGSAIYLRGVDYHSYVGTHNWELWYSSTSLTGNPGPITVANGWTQAVGSTSVVCATAGVMPIFSGMNTVIPANTTYRFAIVNNYTQISYGASGSIPNLFSAIGVNLLVGDYNTNTGFAGNWITPNWAFSPRFFNGNIHIEPAVPCTNPPTPGTSEVSSNLVCFNDDIDLSLNGNSAGNLQTYQWEFSQDGITYTNISPVMPSDLLTYAAQVTGYYRCRIVCSNGTPVFSTPVLVTVNTPQIYSVTDTNVCGGGVFLLNAEVDPGIVVNWYDAQTGGNLLATSNPFQTPNIPNIAGTTTFYAEAVNSNNSCPTPREASSITVVEAPNLDLGSNLNICVDEGHVEFLDAQNPGSTYLWDNNYLGRVRAVTQSGTYTVAVTNNFGCTTYDTVIVNFKPNPKSTLMNDTAVCLNH